MINILISIILVVILLYFINTKESYINNSYLDNVKKNDEILDGFCKKLSNLDDISERNIIYKHFFDEKIKKNDKEINSLLSEINSINRNKINKDIKKKNLHKLKTHNKAIKQIKAINKAKENIVSDNKVKINLK